ncbi:class A beta-lactamase-related serine hydrolase [Marinilabiliaceae bacterium JC017]|nr:class A beta-lactamase-related serine hydrolase [Marinilabiliaceae bacterium JC017]
MKTFFRLFFILLITVNSNAQEEIQINSPEIDKIIEELKDSLSIPAVAVGIAIKGEIKYTNTFGYSNLETHTKLKTNSVWHLCSISKQFSTVACLKLAEENKLSLSDNLCQYIDTLPKEYKRITIANLLSQTSGIKDYLNEKDLFGHLWKEVKKEVFSDSLNFSPGTSWSYSNTGFWIIAKIIEKVSGLDYNQYLEQNFFSKLGMSNTQRISWYNIVPQRVNGYVEKKNTMYNSVADMNQFCGQGDGDITSTINDLLKWNLALANGTLLQKESIANLWCPTTLKNGNKVEVFPHSAISYGMGWFIKKIKGYNIVWTPGSGFGFSASSQYIPQKDLTIIVFCNKEQFLMADDIGFSIAQKLIN